jgi:hypothetical protein
MQAVGMHYWPTRIIGPTGYAIGGTAQQALQTSSTAAIISGPRHYGPDGAAKGWSPMCCNSCSTVSLLPVPTGRALQKKRANALHMEERAMTNNDDGSYGILSRPAFKGLLGINPKRLRDKKIPTVFYLPHRPATVKHLTQPDPIRVMRLAWAGF